MLGNTLLNIQLTDTIFIIYILKILVFSRPVMPSSHLPERFDEAVHCH